VFVRRYFFDDFIYVPTRVEEIEEIAEENCVAID